MSLKFRFMSQFVFFIERYISIYPYGLYRLEESIAGWLAHKGRPYVTTAVHTKEGG